MTWNESLAGHSARRDHTASRDRARAQRHRRRILRSRNQFWRSADLLGPASTAQHLLNDLTEAGELRRLRKGLYWRGTKTPLGMSPPPTDALVRELAPTTGVGPAGLSAANALRLSTQVPRRSEIAVPARPPADLGTVKFVSRAARTARKSARLTATEVALLEALDGWERLLEVSPAEAWERLSRMLADGTVRPGRLAQAARTEPAAARARLEALLRDSGHPAEAERVPHQDPRTMSAALRHTPVVAATA